MLEYANEALMASVPHVLSRINDERSFLASVSSQTTITSNPYLKLITPN